MTDLNLNTGETGLVSATFSPRPASSQRLHALGRSIDTAARETTEPRDRLRLAFYVHALAGGGAERVWCLLASHLAERGHDITMVVDYPAKENLRFLSPSVRLHILGGSHLENTLRLARFIRSARPDVMISALASSNLKLALAALLTGSLRRTIISFHGYAESEPRRLSRLGFMLTPVLSRLTARTLCVSDGLLAYMRTRWGASPSRSRRVYNPVALEGMTPLRTAAALADRPPVVLAVGRLVSYKNFGLLLQGFATVRVPRARLIILGDGPDRAALEQEAAALGLAERVSFRGYVEEPWAAFEEARCLALTSRSESFGLVVVEALAHGLPVVATDCDGPREILTTPSIGRLVPQDDAASLGQALTAALGCPGEPAPRLERAADFQVATIAQAYEAIFAEIRQPPTPSRRLHSGPSRRMRGFGLAMAAVATLVFFSNGSHPTISCSEIAIEHLVVKGGAKLSTWFHL